MITIGVVACGAVSAACSYNHPAAGNSSPVRTAAGHAFAVRTGVAATTSSSPSSSLGPSSGLGPSITTPAMPHVMVIVEENHSYDQVIGNPAMPYLNSLAASYGLATNYAGVSHPSEPNYLAMISGSIWNNPQDATPQESTYPGPTLVDQLAAKGIGWKAYIEDMPTACDTSDNYGPGGYDVNHNPFMYFDSVRNSPAQCARDVPYPQFAIDLTSGSAPPFLFVTPNTTHDMHDGTYQQGDRWLAQQFPVILASAWYRQGGIVIVTFDEGETSDQVATIVISAANHGSRLAAPTNHYGLLRGVEELYGLPLLGAAASTENGDLLPLLRAGG
ncbi:MAG: alkaline phosphatase family protein [Actinomycetota bacterium]|nr:alkaline phosphatase family protein [Actinomycetota bacterium]